MTKQKILDLGVYTGFKQYSPIINIEHIRAILVHENEDGSGTIEIILDTGLRLQSLLIAKEELRWTVVKLHEAWADNLG